MEFLNPRVWLAIIIAMAIGFCGGYYTKTKFGEAAIATQVIKDEKNTAKNIVVSAATSQKVETSVDHSNNEVTKIEQAVAKRHPLVKPAQQLTPQTAQENSNAKVIPVTEIVQNTVSCDSYQLDVGTVRLLNAARKGVGLDSIAGSNEALSAPSGITVDKLLQNDLEVVKLYQDLAKRHDELVTEVEDKLKQQAE